MTKTHFRLVSFLLIALLPGCSHAGKKLVFYHTNDIHGYITSSEAKFYKENPKRLIGGFAVLANLVKQEKGPYLLLDSGDIFSGAPEGSLTGGESVVTLMNHLGYAAAAIGNHEFDKKERNLTKLAKQAKFPFLSANIYLRYPKTKGKDEQPSYATAYTIREINGVKVGIMGLITPDTPRVTMPKNVARLKFLRPVNVAKKVVQELRSQGCDLVIALSHIGWAKPGESDFEDDKYLAAHVPGIDVILGGHTHTFLKEPYQDPTNKTIIIQSGRYLTASTRLELELDGKNKIQNFKHKLIDLWVDEIGEDAETLKLVNRYKDAADKKLSKVIGTTNVDLVPNRDAESLLGNLVSDSMKDAVASDIALQNSGGIRDSISAGPITLRSVYSVLPFDNTIVVFKFTGSQIREILETSAAGSISRMQVSGLRVRYDSHHPRGHRIKEIWIGSKPLSETREYTLATNSFIAQGGDGYKTFLNAQDKKDTGIMLRDAMASYVEKNTPINAKVEGRITEEK